MLAPLPTVGLILLGWGALSLAGLILPVRWLARVSFPVMTLLALALVWVILVSWSADIDLLRLPIGLPGWVWHARLDPLSAFFLLLLGLVSAGVSLYATGYFRPMSLTDPAAFRRVMFFYPLFLASMGMVLVADDAYAFMVAWEVMALSSWFLVILDHPIADIRQAGFLYLLMSHLGALCLLACFGLLGQEGVFDFATLRHGTLSTAQASSVLMLGLLGFGAKAGLLPLHVWLPEAHPAAPSPVSALMSGVMLKVALYGMMRLTLDLLGPPHWWWGALLVVLGSMSALYGVLFAAVQSDIKRLLAWSSVENMGLMFSGLGLTLLFHSAAQETVAALALVAVLYHALNHGLFKALLFLCTGSVLHATTERNMAKLGGLIRTMPWVASLALIGVLSLAGLPPFNGFISEWLMLQAYLLHPDFPQPWLDMALPLGAAALALVGALSGYAMVKFYGIVFLGQPRGLTITQVHDAGYWERLGMSSFALGCVLLGLFPTWVIVHLDRVTEALVGRGLGASAAHHGWLWLTPVAAQRASYSPIILLAGIIAGVALTIFGVRYGFRARSRRAPAWDCGYPAQTWRMQDSADGFGQPIKQIFEGFFGLSRDIPEPDDPQPHYRSDVRDPFWAGCYLPLVRSVDQLTQRLARFQRVPITTYLLYSFVTLLGLLAMVTWGTT